jgi:hypothetical protein
MIEDIKKNVTAELNAVSLEPFADCFQKPFERCNKCIQLGEDYFLEIIQLFISLYFLLICSH